MKFKILFSTLIFVILFSYVTFAQLTILSGPKQGSYHSFGEDIVSVTDPKPGNTFVNEVTSGAAYNYNQLIDPESPYKFALIQSDYLYYMQALDNRDNTEKTKPIKVIFPLAHEEIHIVTKAKSGLTKLQDLGKTKNGDQKIIVAIGTQDQGTYATANLIKDRSQIFWASRNIHFDDVMHELFMDRIDAFVMVGSAPLKKLDVNPQALAEEIALIELNNFNDWAKYYDNDTIYSNDYKWLEKDVPTFSVRTLLVVNESKLSDADKQTVNALKNGIMNHFDELKSDGHPKWKEVDLFDWTDSDWPMYK